MKKLKLLAIFITTLFIFTMSVYAASASLSVSSTSVKVGDKFTVKVKVSSAAAWNVHVTSSGPVSGCKINQADATSDAKNTTKTFSASCKATGEGTITITLTGDVTSASDGKAVKVSGTKTVTVKKKTTNNDNNNNNTNNTNTDNKSSNNKLKSISVEGYDLKKVDNNNYKLTVPNDVKSVTLKVTAADSKARVSGAGRHDLKVGDNTIKVIITAENGAQNKINVKITRKDGNGLGDIDTLLNSDKDALINIGSDTVIPSEVMKKIDDANKVVTFNYSASNGGYSWIIDGNELNNTNSIKTGITNDSVNKKEIQRLSNYADMLLFNLLEKNTLPTGVKIRLYVGDKFENKDIVNVYGYKEIGNELSLVAEKLTVNNGYVEFETKNMSEYIVTMSTIRNDSKEAVTCEKPSHIVCIIIIVILLLIIGGLGYFIYTLMKKKDENNPHNNLFRNSYNRPHNY